MNRDQANPGAAAMVPLHALAEITLGYLCRRRIEPDPNGSHALILTRNVDAAGALDGRDLVRIAFPGNPARYQVQADDLLFLACGKRFPVIGPLPDLPDTLATACFYRVRPDPTAILPAYLAWMLNQAAAQAYFHRHAQGSRTLRVTKRDFERVPVPVPERTVQETIAALQALWTIEVAENRKILMARERLIRVICNRAARQGPTVPAPP